MNAKKYLSLEEAAEFLGISTQELKTLREQGEIRGFADRATWKFRAEDLTEFARSRGMSSNPDFDLIDDEDALADQKTIISSKSVHDEDRDFDRSDSDVRLVIDDDLVAADSDTGLLMGKDSDSDVRLVEEQATKASKSDSDVRLLASDSDAEVQIGGSSTVLSSADSRMHFDKSDSAITIVPDDSGVGVKTSDSGRKLGDSDSDVKLVTDSDSDVKLVGASSDSDVKLVSQPGKSALSDSATRKAGDSGSILGDSELSLSDSGISLDLDSDSGISLLSDDDSVTLGSGDSGIALEKAGDSGISLEGDLGSTSPMKPGQKPQIDDMDETQLEVPVLAEDSDFELSGTDFDIPALSQGESDTGVIVFDDESAEEFVPTVAGKGGQNYMAADLDQFDAESDLDVAPDFMGEDDGLDDLDVFEATDDEFHDSFQTSGSQAEFAAPAGVQMVAAEPAPWGVGSFLGVFAGTAVLVVCAMVMFELVRSLWAAQEPLNISSPIVSMLAGLFK